MSSIFDVVVKSKTGRNIGNNVLWLNTKTNQLMLRTRKGWIPLNCESGSIDELSETVTSLENKVDNLSDQLSTIDSVASVVTELPTENIKENKIYMVKKSEDESGNSYDEYLYVNGSWELVGNYKTTIDLSEYITSEKAESTYATKEEISNKADSNSVYTKDEIEEKGYVTMSVEDEILVVTD